MLVVVAVNPTQDPGSAHPAHALEGELVAPVAARCAGTGCGGAEGFVGLVSGRPARTAIVVERPGVTEPDLWDAVRDHLVRSGWPDLVEAGDGHDDAGPLDRDLAEEVLDELCDEHVREIARHCARVGEGALLGSDGEAFERAVTDAA